MAPLWSDVPALLGRWHSARDHGAAREAVAFLEVELRLAFPPAARRRWPPEQLEDALRGFLARLLDRPLPNIPADPRAYLLRGFRNWCISVDRRGRREEPLDEEMFPAPEPDEDVDDRAARRQQVSSAMEALAIADAVALKMVDAPDWLTDAEISWLSERAGRTESEVRTMLLSAPDLYDLTFLFDPGTPNDAERRHRMERFRRRRGRAREALRSRIGVAP